MTDDARALAAHMLKALEAPVRELTKWEADFVDSVRDQFADRQWLSERQLEILERVYTEKTV